MVSRFSNQEMIAYWQGNGFQEVILVDAKEFDDSGQESPYADSTQFSQDQRLAFTQAVLEGMDRAARSALSGTLTAFIIKQMKGAGVHVLGAERVHDPAGPARVVTIPGEHPVGVEDGSVRRAVAVGAALQARRDLASIQEPEL